MRNGVAGAVGVGAVGAVGGGEQPDPEFVRRGIRFLRGTYSHPVADQGQTPGQQLKSSDWILTCEAAGPESATLASLVRRAH